MKNKGTTDSRCSFVLCGLPDFRLNLKCGRMRDVFFNRTLIGGTNYSVFVLFRKIRRQLNVERNFAHHAGRAINVHALDDLNAFSGNATLLAKTQDVNTGARANRCEKSLEGRWRGTIAAGLQGLIGLEHEIGKVRVNALAARKIDLHFHV